MTLRSLENTILSAIRGRPATGLAILDRIHEATGNRCSLGAIYVSLERLEAAGLLRGEYDGGEIGKRRLLFTLTAAGAELAAVLPDPPAVPPRRDVSAVYWLLPLAALAGLFIFLAIGPRF